MFYVLVSGKGGVGKSVLAGNVLGSYLYEKKKKSSKNVEKITLVEMDNNNETCKEIYSKSTTIEPISETVAKGSKKLSDYFLDVMNEDKDIVIDSGGGDDTKKVLESLHYEDCMSNTKFFIPLLKNRDHIKNTRDTYNLIRKYSEDALVVFVLNQASEFNMETVKEEFKYFFGDESLGIKNFYSDLKKEDTHIGVTVVVGNIYFEVVQDYGRTLFDIAIGTLDTNKLKKEKALEAKEKNDRSIFIKAQQKIRIKKIAEEIKKEVLDKIFNAMEKQGV